MTDDIAAIANILRHSVITFGGVVQTELGPQAADVLSASLAREEVLRKALETIAIEDYEPRGGNAAAIIALKALEQANEH